MHSAKNILTSVDGSETYRYKVTGITDSLIRSVLFNRYTVLPLTSVINSYEFHKHINSQNLNSSLHHSFVEKAIEKGWIKPTFHENLGSTPDPSKSVLEYLKDKYWGDEGALPTDILEMPHYSRFLKKLSENIEYGFCEYLPYEEASGKKYLEIVKEYLFPNEKDFSSLKDKHPNSIDLITNVLRNTEDVRKRGFNEAMENMAKKGKEDILSRGILIKKIGEALEIKKDETKATHIDYILDNLPETYKKHKNDYSILFKWINRAHHMATASVLDVGISIPKFSYYEDFIQDNSVVKESSPRDVDFSFGLNKPKRNKTVLLPKVYPESDFDNYHLVAAREIEGDLFFKAWDEFNSETKNPDARENLEAKFAEYAEVINKSIKTKSAPSWINHPLTKGFGKVSSCIEIINQFRDAPLMGIIPSEVTAIGATFFVINQVINHVDIFKYMNTVPRSHYTVNLSNEYLQNNIRIY